MIIRPKPLNKSRYKKIRLDKNEKIDEFKRDGYIEFLDILRPKERG